MDGKKADTRFTLQFNQIDPAHLQVAEILNNQGRRGKAQYIVNAVLHYEHCDEAPDLNRPARIDDKAIEAVVNRILRGKVVDTGSVRQPASASATPAGQEPKRAHPVEEISFDDAMESLGEDGFNAVVGALDMFRRK